MSSAVKYESIVIEDDDDDYDLNPNAEAPKDELKYEDHNPDQYCALCLRERSPNSQFLEYRDENCTMFREYLKDLINFELNLEYVIICVSCYKMVDMVDNFKQSCLKARHFIEQVGVGLKCGDEWLAEETVKAIERIDETIRKHAEQMEPAGSDPKSEMEYDDMKNEDDVISIESDEEIKPSFEIIKDQGFDQLEFSFGIPIGADENDFIQYVDSSDLDSTGKNQFKVIRNRAPGTGVKCPICGAMLSNRFNLKEHLFTHGDATQQCYFCPKKFKQRTNLLRHHRTKHSEIPVRNLYPSLHK